MPKNKSGRRRRGGRIVSGRARNATSEASAVIHGEELLNHTESSGPSTPAAQVEIDEDGTEDNEDSGSPGDQIATVDDEMIGEEEDDADDDERDAEGDEDDDDQPGGDASAAANNTDTAMSTSSTPKIESIPRKKKPGRPPKRRPGGWESPKADDHPASDSTPAKKRRGRPPGGGFRGRPKGSFATPSRVRVDKAGTLANVVDDEIDLPEDSNGEKKVDKNGNLLGGREYRVRTFTISNHGKRLFMLSTEPARCCGFRDSYLFFAKHLRLHKIVIDDDEKHDLIDRDVIPHSYKGRAIGVVTARSVFREFGAKIIVAGRNVLDDYYEQQARARGDVEGELADPYDRLPLDGQPYNRNQYVAWHGASAVYHTNAPAVPAAVGKPAPKRRIQITSTNWQIEHARAASQFNARIARERKAVWDGIYDPHTNLVHYPKCSQPTHVKWELYEDQHTQSSSSVSASTIDSLVEPVSATVAGNFMVVDTVFTSAPVPGCGIPGVDGGLVAAGPTGLPEATDEILALLPDDCRKAFLNAKQLESDWKQTWTDQTTDCMRGRVKIAFLGYPV